MKLPNQWKFALKKLLPSSLKDLAKAVLGRGLASAGWKLAPLSSTVLEGHWYEGMVDGVVSKHRPPAIEDQEFCRAIEHLAKDEAFPSLTEAMAGKVALFRLYLARQLAVAANAIEGDFVEFGTFRGATAYCMLQATAKSILDEGNESASGKPMYLYDTFSGIPNSGMSEHERGMGLEGGFCETSVDRVAATLREFEDRIRLRPGLIPETLDESGPRKIAMMHVDLNLASPTLDALAWAWDKWTPGGFCLLDDYLWDGFEDQRRVVEQFFRERSLPIIALPTGQGLVIRLC